MVTKIYERRMNTEIIEKMTLYRIRETFESPKFDLNILLNKNPDYDFTYINYSLFWYFKRPKFETRVYKITNQK